jgi:hypothetical protein
MTEAEFDTLCASFPETAKGQSYGYPSWKAFGKFWVRLRPEDNSLTIRLVDIEEREVLIAAEPDTFHVTDHYRGYPIVLARLEKLDIARLRHMLTPSWRKNAPRRWLKAHDAGQGG